MHQPSAPPPAELPKVPTHYAPVTSVQATPVLVHSSKPVIPRDRLLRLPDVEQMTGIKKSTIYGRMREGKFPACVRISRRLSVWPESAVLSWVHARIQEGGAQ